MSWFYIIVYKLDLWMISLWMVSKTIVKWTVNPTTESLYVRFSVLQM